ncbi:hypothetical protein ABZU75_23410 [Streptosporangium sp. NPDC005286]|uniref:DUF7739 domain-containing protein n=1 Tax=Streptosporangium sp. NPDC005286 TaxID=3154463 RepID=UPI0033B38A39
MGIFFGKNTGTRSYGCSEELAKKVERKGGKSSTGAAQLLGFMRNGSDTRTLRGEEAEQAARSLREVAPRLRGNDRRIAEQIARDAQAAADSGRPWTIG